MFFKDTPRDLSIALQRLETYFLTIPNTQERATASQEDSIRPLEKELFVEKEDMPLVVKEFVKSFVKEIDISDKQKEIVKKYEEWIQPKQQDTLFWCLFIAHHGHGEYLHIDRNYGLKEMETKKLVGEFAMKHPERFKDTNQKITKVAIQEIRSECLTSSKETSMNCLLAMCVFYKFNVILVEATDRFFLEYRADMDDETSTYLFKRDTFGKYSILVEAMSKVSVEEWKKERLELLNHMKPIRAVGAYKVEELEALARRLNVVDETKKMKKGEMYTAIGDVMKWY